MASSENGNGVRPRDTVWVVNTVTTLGATFSTTGAKLAITPGCMGAVSCAEGEEALVERYRMAPINNPKDRKIPFCIKVPPFRESHARPQSALLAIQQTSKLKRIVAPSMLEKTWTATLSVAKGAAKAWRYNTMGVMVLPTLH